MNILEYQHSNIGTLQDKVLRRILASCTKLDRYREMLTDISHSDLKAESEYLSLLISSLDEPSDDTQALSNSQLAKYVVFECVYISHYHENITLVINLYYKEITRTPTLECTLEYYENSDTNARTQVHTCTV